MRVYPRYRNLSADETFLCSRENPQAFVVTSPHARNLTPYAPAEFDAIVLMAGSASSDPVELTWIARG